MQSQATRVGFAAQVVRQEEAAHSMVKQIVHFVRLYIRAPGCSEQRWDMSGVSRCVA